MIEKIRKVLIADSTLNGYTKKRVYGSHISSVNEPKHPAISLFVLSSRRSFSERGYVTVQIQIDAWLQNTRYDHSDVFAVQDRIRTLLDRQNLIDSAIPISVGSISEVSAGPIMDDPDKDLMHFPSIVQVVAT